MSQYKTEPNLHFYLAINCIRQEQFDFIDSFEKIWNNCCSSSCGEISPTKAVCNSVCTIPTKIRSLEANYPRNMDSQDRWTLVEKSKICQAAERWDEMIRLLRILTSTVTELKAVERNLLSLAYKHIVGAKRASWRVISSIEKRLEASQRKKQLSKEYRLKIEHEIRDCCSEIFTILEKNLNNTDDMESRIFYLKMRGDYYRYLAEFTRYEEYGDVYHLAKQAYEEALELAKENVSAAHPVRLGVVLNYSVFYHEIMNLQDAAVDIARDAHKLAEADLDNIREESYNDSSLIIELLKDNIALWTADAEDVPRRKSVR